MNNFVRKAAFFAVFLYAGMVMVLGPGEVLAQDKDEVGEKQEQLEKLQSQIQKKKTEILAVKKKEQQALQKLVEVKTKLKETRGELNYTFGRLNLSRQRLGQLNLEMKSTETKLGEKKTVLGRRLSEAFKSGGVNYLELIFGAKSLSDFVNKAYYFERILGSDLKLVQDIISYYRDVGSKHREQQTKTSEIAGLAQVIAQKEKEIKSNVWEKNQLYGQLKTRRQDYEEQLRKMEQTSYEMEAMIQRYMAEQGRRGVVGPLGTGKFIWPLTGEKTSPFGYRRHPIWGGRNFHTGLDIAAPYGKRIVAADSGLVIFAGWWDGYGKAVIIDHGKGTTTVYGHLSRIYVKKDQKIVKGNTVGLVGSTGYSTGPHLHFEVRRNGTPVNPIKWLP
jgi:murein DD-endopeptidase MepM/ murein hydrolase activator NlpD